MMARNFCMEILQLTKPICSSAAVILLFLARSLQMEANAMKRSVLTVTMLLILFAPGRAAAQLKLLVGGAVTEPVKKVDAEFAKKSGHRSEITSDTSGALQN